MDAVAVTVVVAVVCDGGGAPAGRMRADTSAQNVQSVG